MRNDPMDRVPTPPVIQRSRTCYLIEAMDVDPDTGEFLFGDDGYPVSRALGILVRWSEVVYLEFIEA